MLYYIAIAYKKTVINTNIKFTSLMYYVYLYINLVDDRRKFTLVNIRKAKSYLRVLLMFKANNTISLQT